MEDFKMLAPANLNAAGQQHVADFLTKWDLVGWSQDGVCSAIEGHPEFGCLKPDGVAYIEVIRRGKINNDAPIDIEILADTHVQFDEVEQ